MKVFGIGLARTGTTSLHYAFLELGLRSAPSSVALMPLLDDPTTHVDLLDVHDAFTDNPIPFLYELLDAKYPGSRFVHVVRPRAEWLDSMAWLFSAGLERLDPPTRELGDAVHLRLYGTTVFDREVLSNVYDDHHRRVDAYFRDRPEDILRADLGHLDWVGLSDFLRLPMPSKPFPHANSSVAGLIGRKSRWSFGVGSRVRGRGSRG